MNASARPEPRSAMPRWLALALLVFASACWAGSSVAGRAAVGDVPPMALSFLRWFIAFLVLLPLGARPLWAERRIVVRHLPIMCAFAFFGVVGFTVPYYVGLRFTEAVNVGILNASSPTLIILLTFAMLGVAIRPAQFVGVGFALVGTLIIVSRGDIEILLGFVLNVGDMLALSAFLSWAMYTVMLRWRPPGVSSYSFLVAIFALASLMMLPLYAVELALGRSFEHNVGNWFIIGYAALFPSTLAYLAWNVAVPIVGPNLAAITQYLNPVFAITLAALILGETVEDFHLAGIATILLGIYLSGRRRKRGEPEK
jgi:drug/metabolite transporter (DMT)-like permease